MELAGKAALVTGAAKGIGAAVAQLFARYGASVAIMDRDTEAAESCAGAIRAAGGRALAVAGDVSIAADAQRAVAEAVVAFGGLDLLVNNAGIQTYGTVETMPEEEWDRTLAINLKSVFLLSKYAVPEIRRRGGGAIVNIASVQALATQPAVSAYAASKGGIVSMTRSMALDFAGDAIRVNCVCPGSVDTPMLRWAATEFGGGDPEGALRDWGKLHALGRVARAEEVAELVLFLASPRSSFCTGAAYLADGGMLASF
jgi:NAD(P)-dependent dehydrogenase (short-subunit alcohol dehydrogenase family)